MKIADNFQPSRFEPTVFGAVRRYRVMVLAIAVAAMLAAVGYTLMQGKTYQAQVSITVPQEVSLQGQDTAQYLDSQVLLLQSPAVARQAASIANAALHSTRMTARDFSGDGSSLQVTPPAAGNAGSTATASSWCRSPGRTQGSRRWAPTRCSRPWTTSGPP